MVLSMCYAHILQLLTLIIAIKSYRITLYEHESLGVLVSSALTMASSVICSLIYLLARQEYKAIAVCVDNTITSSVVLGFIFGPKVRPYAHDLCIDACVLNCDKIYIEMHNRSCPK